MNPVILLGLGAVALMAMGGKKKKTEPEERPDEGDRISPLIAKKVQPTIKKAAFTKLPPINYPSIISSQTSAAEAKQCHLQGMNNVDQIAMCIANKIFPDWRWDTRSGWQVDAWGRMKNIARIELGMDPIIT